MSTFLHLFFLLFFYSSSCANCAPDGDVRMRVNPNKDASCPDDCYRISHFNLGYWMATYFYRMKDGERPWLGDNPGIPAFDL